LEECRKKVAETLRQLGHTVIGMEDYTADGRPPLKKVLADIAECDAYLGIFAWRYGYIPREDNPRKLAITELEYREALRLNPDVWLSPLMILGTQWYILFNVIAGAAALPSELRDVGVNLRVGGWLWWRRVALPGVFPYYVTGAITASGGSWNASIVAEVASWGDRRLEAHGLGAYIARATEAADYHRIVLGIAVMSLFVVIINRAFWRPLYWRAERTFRLG